MVVVAVSFEEDLGLLGLEVVLVLVVGGVEVDIFWGRCCAFGRLVDEVGMDGGAG